MTPPHTIVDVPVPDKRGDNGPQAAPRPPRTHATRILHIAPIDGFTNAGSRSSRTSSPLQISRGSDSVTTVYIPKQPREAYTPPQTADIGFRDYTHLVMKPSILMLLRFGSRSAL